MSLRSKILKFSALASAAISLALAFAYSNAETINSTSYKPVASKMNVSTGDKIEVAELFWFGCGHCYALEPSIKKWKESKPENAEFVKIPAIFSSAWEFHGKAFYTMQALNVPEKAYDEFFQNIHVKRKRMSTLNSLVVLLEGYDKTAEEIQSAFNSFEVDSKVRAAKKISRQSGATGVPAIIVDGKYLTSQTMTGGVEGLFKTVDQLVEKAASER